MCSIHCHFITWEWLYTWAMNYLGKDRLFIILAFEGTRLVGIAPFYIRRINCYRVLPLRQIEFLGTGEVCSSHLDFIVDKNNRGEFINKVYTYLLQEEAGCDWPFSR